MAQDGRLPLAGPVAAAGKGPDHLRRAAAFGPGNQPADPFLDPDLRLPPQQLLGFGGTIPQLSLGGGGHCARRLLVEGLEGRARQPQQDLGDLVERGATPVAITKLSPETSLAIAMTVARATSPT